MDRWDGMAVAALLLIAWSVWTLGGAPGLCGYAGVLLLAVAVGHHVGERSGQSGRSDNK